MSKKCKKAWLWRSKDKNARKKNCKKKLSEINTGKKEEPFESERQTEARNT